MIKIKGLNKLSQQLKDAEKALSGIDGDIGTVNFNPNDPASIEAAIQEVENMIDEKLSQYEHNPIVASLAESMKEQYREGIVQRAAEERLKNQME